MRFCLRRLSNAANRGETRIGAFVVGFAGDGESVQFPGPFEMKGQVENWLNDLTRFMQAKSAARLPASPGTPAGATT